jgi:hypothetical protein
VLPLADPKPPVPSKNLLTNKVGPLPMWAWALMMVAVLYAYERYKTNKAAKASTTTPTQNTPGTNAAGSGLTPSVIQQNFGGGGVTPATAPSAITVEQATPGTGGTAGSTQGAMYPITMAQAEALLLKGNYPFQLQSNGTYARVGTASQNTASIQSSLNGKGQLYAGPNDYQGLLSGQFPIPAS